jgi:hypothetical protein
MPILLARIVECVHIEQVQVLLYHFPTWCGDLHDLVARNIYELLAAASMKL